MRSLLSLSAATIALCGAATIIPGAAQAQTSQRMELCTTNTSHYALQIRIQFFDAAGGQQIVHQSVRGHTVDCIGQDNARSLRYELSREGSTAGAWILSCVGTFEGDGPNATSPIKTGRLRVAPHGMKLRCTHS